MGMFETPAIPPLPPLAHLSDLSALRTACQTLTSKAWTDKERVEGRHVYAGCNASDWPHFKAYFELLGFDVEAMPAPPNAREGYVETAVIKPKAPS